MEEFTDKAYELLDRYDMKQSIQAVGLKDVDKVYQDQMCVIKFIKLLHLFI